MIENILRLYQTYAELTSGNQFLSATLAAFILGIVTWTLKNIPLKIYLFIKSRIIVTLMFNNDTHYENRETFTKFTQWAKERTNKFVSKNFTVSHQYNKESHKDEQVMRPGRGSHVFFYKGSIFWYSIESESVGSQSNVLKEQLVLKTFGFSRKKLENLFNDVFPKENVDELGFYSFIKDEWVRYSGVHRRPLESVILDKQIKNSIIDSIDKFKENKQWYISNGISYKQSILLTGQPGTGKTSFIKALGSRIDRPIYSLSISNMPDPQFEDCINRVPPGSIIVMEDIDAMSTTTFDDRAQDTVSSALNTSVSMSKMLNVLDGIKPMPANTLIIMTTNHPEKLDPAFMRKGRIDNIYDFGPLKYQEVKDYIKYQFNDDADWLQKDIIIKGCDLQSILMDSFGDFEKFKKQLLEVK